MSSREGRGRPHRDYYPARSEQKSHHGRGSNPPSRHLWVGNLSHNLTEADLAHYFLRFGELESVAFQPGRSYAFINYKHDEQAFAAVKELQGFVIDGNPLRIEFAKAEKSGIQPRDADYSQRRDDRNPTGRESPFTQRDSRARHASPERPYMNKSKMNNKDAEPSEVLWIGFPAQLKVDEFILRKAFSPFGEIEKITAFPGRSYAFVSYRNVMAACRAKETLQGKLFGNPRVHICFAKNESGTSNRERNPTNSPPSPHSGSYGRSRSPEYFRSDRNFGGISEDPSIRSPRYIPNFDPGNHDLMGIGGNANRWPGGDDHEQRRFPRQGSDLRLPGNIYKQRDSPSRNMDAHYREFSPQGFRRQGPFYDDPWDLPEDVSLLHGTKKLRTDSFPPDNELPEYPLSDLQKVKYVIPPDVPQPGVLDNNFDYRPSGHRLIPDHLASTTPPFGRRGNHLNASVDNFQVGSSPLPPRDLSRLIPDQRESSSKQVWKWEGLITKGGNPVCGARCFPVGKPMDMVLPQCLDCTARTSLDMLAKHYYEAASAWIVFFVPADDQDISYYNEFMNYLGEKQRAAVVKIDERTTMFLVPPSEFSEKVLKVPGKLSMSGVVLRIDPQNSSHESVSRNENKEATFTSIHGGALYQKPASPARPYLPTPPPMNYEKSGTSGPHFPGNLPSGGAYAPVADTAHSMHSRQPVDAQGHDYMQTPTSGPIWSTHNYQNSNPTIRNIESSGSVVGSIAHTYSSMPKPMQETTHNNYISEISSVPSSGNGKPSMQEKLLAPSSMPVGSLPPEHLAQLASSLFGQQSQLGGMPNTGEYMPSGNINQPGYSFKAPHNYGLPNDQVSSEFAPPQFNQMQQFQQQSPNLSVAPQREAQAAAQVNQQLQNAGQDDPEADPQVRLQATLQLAAALLQQIQQGKGKGN